MSISDVDVIVSATPSPGAVARLLRSLPAGFSPIVVSDGSHVGLVEVVRSSSARLVIEPRRGFGFASLAGLAVATTPVVAIVDPHLEVGAQDLASLVAAVVRGDADVALTPRRAATSAAGRLVERAVALGRTPVIGRSRPERSVGNPLGARAAWRSDLEGLAVQDRGHHWAAEMLQRAADAGLRVVELDSAAGRSGGHRAPESSVVR